MDNSARTLYKGKETPDRNWTISVQWLRSVGNHEHEDILWSKIVNSDYAVW